MFKPNPIMRKSDLNFIFTLMPAWSIVLSLHIVDHESPLYLLKVHNRNQGFSLKTAYRIEAAFNSLFMDKELNMISAVHRRYQKNDVCVFFTSDPSRIQTVFKLLLQEMSSKKPILERIAQAPIIGEPGTIILPERLKKIAESVVAAQPNTPLIINLRSSLFYNTLLANVEPTLTPSQQQAIAGIKKTTMKGLSIPGSRDAKVTEESLSLFRDNLVVTFEKNKSTPKERRFVLKTQLAKAREAYDKDNLDLAIKLYEQSLTPQLTWQEQTEAYYELFCLYGDKENNYKMLANLTKCYNIIIANANFKSKYYSYWEENIRVTLFDLIYDFYFEAKDESKLDKEIIQELFESYQAIKSLIRPELDAVHYYRYLSEELLKLLIKKLEKYCTKVREEIEISLVVSQESAYKKEGHEIDPLSEMLLSEFEYTPTYSGEYGPPGERPNYQKHRTTFEQDLGILPVRKPKNYLQYLIRQQQPSRAQLEYARNILFTTTKHEKRLPPVTERLLLPTPKEPKEESPPKPKRELPHINIHLAINMRVIDEILTPSDLEKYIERIFTEHEKTRTAIFKYLTTSNTNKTSTISKKKPKQNPNCNEENNCNTRNPRGVKNKRP